MHNTVKPLLSFTLLVATASACFGFDTPSAFEIARWRREAHNVTIVRGDWGIAHVYGNTDADAVFGMMYAQAQDDFNRVETNYINALGHSALDRSRRPVRSNRT
jgi:acyl-homoserine-lactone acylase